MTEKTDIDQDEISLVDIYEFFKDGWKTLVGLSALGLSAGVIAAFVIPEKFQASALIEPAAVASKAVESTTVLVEKMKSPTYYSIPTIEACGLTERVNPQNLLVQGLKPVVGRNSPYVSVSYRALSPADANKCLEFVLKDVAQNQAQLAKPLINNMEVTLVNAELELQSNVTERPEAHQKPRKIERRTKETRERPRLC